MPKGGRMWFAPPVGGADHGRDPDGDFRGGAGRACSRSGRSARFHAARGRGLRPSARALPRSFLRSRGRHVEESDGRCLREPSRDFHTHAAVVVEQVGVPAGLNRTPVLTEPLILVAPPGIAGRSELSLLRELPFIRYDRGSARPPDRDGAVAPRRQPAVDRGPQSDALHRRLRAGRTRCGGPWYVSAVMDLIKRIEQAREGI